MDVDIHADHDLLMHLLRQSQSGDSIAMVPVLYLNAIGTLGMRRGLSADRLIHDFMSMRRRWTLHLALPSSFIAFRRCHLASSGLFDETYTGHGYEDFDFMIRLGLSSGILKPSPDLLMDEKTAAPLLARGFRSRLGQIGLQSLLDHRIGFHSFHARSDMHAHRQAQAENRDRFQHRMAALQRTWPPTVPDAVDRADPVPPILREFYTRCHEQGRSPHDLDACLDARPGHLIRSGWHTRLLNRIAGAWSC
jgi:predicted glycosyltransferase involved in capsule biosynthesis